MVKWSNKVKGQTVHNLKLIVSIEIHVRTQYSSVDPEHPLPYYRIHLATPKK